MFRKILFKAASVATLSAAAVATVNAQGFANTLQIAGQAQISSAGAGNGQPLFIDFLSGVPFPGTTGNGAPGNVVALTTTGAFTSIPLGTSGTIQDLEIAGGGSPTTTNPAGGEAKFMTVGGYTFTLDRAGNGATFGPITLADQDGGAVGSFAVFGMVSGPGFASPITYQGTFSTQFVGETAQQVFNQINSGGSPIVSFSANFGAPVPSMNTVPEPSTYALLATGIGALGLVARRRRTEA